jgi:hypothetical protein
VIRLPSGTQLNPVLETAVKCGHCLFLYAYFDHKQANSLSVQEEFALAASLHEYLGTIASSVGTRPSTSGLEAKLPLLYRLLIVLVQRQLNFANEPARVAFMVSQLTDTLLVVADASPGWGQNLLGAIGLGPVGGGDPISVRGKFLARSLAIFLRSLLTPDKGAFIEKVMDTAVTTVEGGSDEESENLDLKSRVLECSEMRQQLDRLAGLQRSKALAGLADLVDWVMVQVRDPSNRLAEAHLFLDHLVVDKLYTELFLKVES